MCVRILRRRPVFSVYGRPTIRLALLGSGFGPVRQPIRLGRRHRVKRGAVRSLRVFNDAHLGLHFQVSRGRRFVDRTDHVYDGNLNFEVYLSLVPVIFLD